MLLPEKSVDLKIPAGNGKKVVKIVTTKGDTFLMVPSHWSFAVIKEYTKRRLEETEELIRIDDKVPVYDTAI